MTFVIFSELAEIKYYPYDKFIQYVFNRVNKVKADHEKIDIEEFNKKVYYGDGIIINMPVYLHDIFDKGRKYQTVALRDKHGFTNGEIFYQMAQFIPNEKEILAFNIDFIRNNADKISNTIENRRKEIENRIKENRRLWYPISEKDNEELNRLNKKFTVDKIKELLENPIRYLNYVNEIGSPYYGLVIKQTYLDILGEKGLFTGLTYDRNQGYYQISFEYSY